MQFSETDMKILVVTGFTVLLVGATAGATPIGGGFGDMPKFESNAELDLSVPSQPGAEVSTNGVIQAGPNVSDFRSTTTFIRSENLLVNLSAAGYKSNPDDTDVNVALLHVDRTTSPPTETADSVTLVNGESAELTAKEVSVVVTATDATNSTIDIEYDVQNYPNPSEYGEGDNSGLISTIGLIAEWLGYIGQMFAYAVDVLFSSITFVFTVLYDIITYVFSITTWLIGGFVTMVGSAPVWAAPFIGLPVMLLGLELLKLLLLAIDILWIG